MQGPGVDADAGDEERDEVCRSVVPARTTGGLEAPRAGSPAPSAAGHYGTQCAPMMGSRTVMRENRPV